MLTGGDRRSIGRTEETVDLVRGRPKKAGALVECLWDDDECVRMRAADAIEKLSRERADLVQPYKTALVGLLAEATQKELRWHVAVVVPRLRLTPAECQQCAEALQKYLDDRSSIVKTFAMQGLYDLTRQHAGLGATVIELIRSLTRSGTPAMRARGRILLKQLEQSES